MAHESDPEISEAIQHSRLQKGAHNTGSLEITRQHSAHANRPLTQREKRERATFGWLIQQKEDPR